MLNLSGNSDDKKKLSPAEKDDITIHNAGKITMIIVIQITALLIHNVLRSEGDIFSQ